MPLSTFCNSSVFACLEVRGFIRYYMLGPCIADRERRRRWVNSSFDFVPRADGTQRRAWHAGRHAEGWRLAAAFAVRNAAFFMWIDWSYLILLAFYLGTCVHARDVYLVSISSQKYLVVME